MQKWNILKDRSQSVDEKNGVIHLVMFTPNALVIKMSKMPHACWIQHKISPSLGKIFECILKVLFSSFRNYCELLRSELPLGWSQHLKLQDFGIILLTRQFFRYFYPHYLTNVKSQVNKIFQVYLNVLLKLWGISRK